LPPVIIEKTLDFIGGADADRTRDLLNAIQALSQLSYSPTGRSNHLSESAQPIRPDTFGRIAAITMPLQRNTHNADLA
jgi:hypothetical protein